MKTRNKKQSVCFAYFGDGEFIGWYGGTSADVSTTPKIYSSIESMRDIITRNFRSKLNKMNSGKTETVLPRGTSSPVKLISGIFDIINKYDFEVLSKYKDIELRVVVCPEYDGPNPDFDEEGYDKLINERNAKFKEQGIYDIPGPSKERFNAVNEFNKTYPYPKCNNWIFADFNKVREWAQNPPTEFIEIITKE